MKDEVFDLIKLEEKRQKETIGLIPSENYTSAAVRKANGSILTNKYAEGYPGKRYYQGNKIIDQIEQLCIDRAKKLFNVPFVNVQPYSGSPANMEVFMSLLNPGDILMGMLLPSGGHLTHGHKVSYSGKLFRSVQFDTDIEGRIDYEAAEVLAKKERPKLIIVGGTAYSRFWDWRRFRNIADSVDAYLVADISHEAGLVAGEVFPSPVPFVDIITSTTHKTLRGPRGAMIMVTDRGLARDNDLEKKINRAVFPGMQGGPHQNTIAALAIALEEASQPEFKTYAQQIVKNAKTLSDELQKGGFTIVTGGTDNHLMLVDLRPLGLSGKQTALDLEEAGVVVNYNSIPHDPAPPLDPSGLRLGTPSVTTRGMKEEEMKLVAAYVIDVIKAGGRGSVKAGVRRKVSALCRRFPIPG